MNDYFHKTKIDSLFYEQYLLKRLPENIMDAHAHLSLPEHLASISPETIAGDWAVQCGAVMTYEDACHYTKIMFPDKQWNFIGLPFPLREADTDGNNAYIASLIKNHSISGLYTLRPEYKIEKIEKEYINGDRFEKKYQLFNLYKYLKLKTVSYFW